MNGKRWAALIIAAGLFFFSIITSIATSSIMSSEENETSFLDGWLGMANESFVEEVIEEGSDTNKIAVLDVDGVITSSTDTTSLLSTTGYNHETFLEKLEMAKEDDSIAGIVLAVNTPGGGVSESAEIYDKLQEIKEETEKPIYVSMGAMATSGGYYISAPADKIFATEETFTGSLGVIMQSYNYEELFNNIGIETVTIKSGAYKDIMSGDREMTEEERTILQTMIDNSYNKFVQIIAEGRGMKEEEVRKIADGRIYDGLQAKEIGLVDEFGYLDDVTDAMKTDLKMEDASVVRYTDSTPFSSLLSASAQNLLGEKLNIDSLLSTVSQPNSPRLMYLYAE
ncbi:MAG: signal peptide peptidase SppA [Bacillus sp. (in: firmicutes)]